MPYASSTGGVQIQDVYPETMRSETLDQIATHQNLLNEKNEQEQSYESQLNDLTKARTYGHVQLQCGRESNQHRGRCGLHGL